MNMKKISQYRSQLNMNENMYTYEQLLIGSQANANETQRINTN